MDVWLRARVVVDVANVAYSIAKAVQRQIGRRTARRHDPELAAVSEVLRVFGIEVTAFDVALPLEPISQLGRAPDPARRRATADDAQSWLSRQRARSPVDVTPVRGATDGHGEIGVDGVCVLAAMLAGWRDDTDGVVVLSRDRDVMLAQDYVADTPIYLASSFAKSERHRLTSGARNWIDLGDESLIAMAGSHRRFETPALPEIQLGQRDAGPLRLWSGARARSSDLAANAGAWLPDREQAASGAGTLAITDPYGLSRAAARAIGVARLPTPSTVEALVRQLGWDGPLGQLAVVPDIVDEMRICSSLGSDWSHAVRSRDAELDALYDAHLTDDDVRTHATRGQLLATRGRSEDGQPIRELEEKQVVSILAADTLWALARTDLPVVVLSDRPEVAYLLEHIVGVRADFAQRLVRIGLHARPFESVPIELETASPMAALADVRVGAPSALRPHLVVLNGTLVARLISLEQQLYGAALTTAIHAELADEDVRWSLVRYDPESRGAVLSPVERPEVEMVFRHMLELECGIAERIAAAAASTEQLKVTIRFDPSTPCAVPAVERGDVDHASDIAIVVAHDDGALHVDTVGDGRGDLVVDVGQHDRHLYGVGRPVVVHRLLADPQGVRLLGPAVPSEAPRQEPIVVSVEEARRATDPDTGMTAALLPLPGAADVKHAAGERVLAVLGDDGCFQTLSTALPHLQDPAPPREHRLL